MLLRLLDAMHRRKQRCAWGGQRDGDRRPYRLRVHHVGLELVDERAERTQPLRQRAGAQSPLADESPGDAGLVGGVAEPDRRAVRDERRVTPGVQAAGIGEREPLTAAEAQARRDEEDTHSLTMVEARVGLRPDR